MPVHEVYERAALEEELQAARNDEAAQRVVAGLAPYLNAVAKAAAGTRGR